VGLLTEWAAPTPGSRVLDLACGAGRHLGFLQEKGMAAVGLDLSLPLLREARAAAGDGFLVRGDMRHLPFADGSFQVVASFFTSFGYFEREEEDRVVLDEIGRILAPGGHVLLDFLNAARVRGTLVPRDEEEVEGERLVQERTLRDGGRLVEKRIEIHRGTGGPPRIFRERVRLYDPGELEALLAERGLTVVERFGDYRGTPFDGGSPRLILLARKGSGGA
jgi:SAM-dependent methyltransferase